jgi:hypothetical protein
MSQIQRLKTLRRWKSIYMSKVNAKIYMDVDFTNNQSYKSKYILAESNVKVLSRAKKSGSWVKFGFTNARIIFWTSRYLSQFKGLPNIQQTRNFGIGIIKSAKFKNLYQVEISSEEIPSSLNIYNHAIISSKAKSDLDEAFYMCVNGASSFQHFIEDCLPILGLAKKTLDKRPFMPIILKKPDANFHNFHLFFELLAIRNPKVFIEEGNIIVKKLHIIDFYPFNAIYCLPKDMYKSVHELVARKNPSFNNKKKNLVVIARRQATRNYADPGVIREEVMGWSEIMGLNPIFIDPSSESLTAVKHVFSNAKYIFGVHGGAIYNVIFAPENATLIEFVPTKDSQSLMHMIMSFGLNYFPYAIEANFNDAKISIGKEDLRCIFKAIEASENSSSKHS